MKRADWIMLGIVFGMIGYILWNATRVESGEIDSLLDTIRANNKELSSVEYPGRRFEKLDGSLLDEKSPFFPSWPKDIGGFSGERFTCLDAPIGNHRARLAVMACHEIERQVCEELGSDLPKRERKVEVFCREGFNSDSRLIDNRPFGGCVEIWVYPFDAEHFYEELARLVRELVIREVKGRTA